MLRDRLPGSTQPVLLLIFPKQKGARCRVFPHKGALERSGLKECCSALSHAAAVEHQPMILPTMPTNILKPVSIASSFTSKLN